MALSPARKVASKPQGIPYTVVVFASQHMDRLIRTDLCVNDSFLLRGVPANLLFAMTIFSSSRSAVDLKY